MNIGKFLKTAILVVIFGSVLTVAISQNASIERSTRGARGLKRAVRGEPRLTIPYLLLE